MTKLAPLLLYTNTPCGMSLWWYPKKKKETSLFLLFTFHSFLFRDLLSWNTQNYSFVSHETKNIVDYKSLIAYCAFLRLKICDILRNNYNSKSISICTSSKMCNLFISFCICLFPILSTFEINQKSQRWYKNRVIMPYLNVAKQRLVRSKRNTTSYAFLFYNCCCKDVEIVYCYIWNMYFKAIILTYAEIYYYMSKYVALLKTRIEMPPPLNYRS